MKAKSAPKKEGGDDDWSDLVSDSELESLNQELGEVLRDIPMADDKDISELIHVSGEAFDPKEIQAVMEKEIEARKAHKEAEARKSQDILDGITEILIEGKGARIDYLDTFEEVGEEDEWGFRRVKLWGKFNFIDRENRILYPCKKDDWFDEVDVFKEKIWKNPSLKNVVLAFGSQGGKGFILANDGRMIPFSEELAKIYYSNKPEDSVWQDVVYEVDTRESPKLSELYWDAFEQKVIALSSRYSDVPETAKAFDDLLGQLRMVQGSLGSGWEAVLSGIKMSVEASALDDGQKAHLLLELRKEAVSATPKLSEEFQNSILALPGLGKADWAQWTQWGKGLVLRIAEGDKAHFNLLTAEGQWLYPSHLAFDSIGSFVGDIALVRRGAQFNFIQKEDGALVSEAWYDEVHGPHQGLFRVKGAEGKCNYVTSKGNLLCAVPFDEAEDFGKSSRARVRLGGEEFFIGMDGKRITSYGVEALKFVRGLFQLNQEKELPKGELKKLILPLVPERAAERRIPRMGQVLHGLFADLLEAEKNRFLRGEAVNVKSLLDLFSGIRKALNRRMAEGNLSGKGMDNASRQAAENEISALIAHANLQARGRLALRQFVLGMSKYRWKEVEPLPVPLLVSFGPLIRENPNEERGLIMLVCELGALAEEMKYTLFARGNMRRLMLKWEVEVQRSKLLPATRRAVKGVILEQGKNKDVYWKGDSSINQYVARSQKGRQIQEMRTRPSSAPRMPRPIENVAPSIDFMKCLRAVKGVSAEAILQACGKYEGLIRDNPTYDFDHRGMAKELYDAIVRLQRGNPSVAGELFDFAIRAFGRALEKNGRDAESHYCLGALLEQRACASRWPWVPGMTKGYKEAVIASEEYGKGLDSAPEGPMRVLLEGRNREVRTLIRSSRIKAAVAAIGLTLMGGGATAGAYHLFGPATVPQDQSKGAPEIEIEMSEPTIRPDSGRNPEKKFKKQKAKKRDPKRNP